MARLGARESPHWRDRLWLKAFGTKGYAITNEKTNETCQSLVAALRGMRRSTAAAAASAEIGPSFDLKGLHLVSFRHNSGISPNPRWSNGIGSQFAYLVFLLLGICALPRGSIHAQDGPTEYQVEATYLFNFLKFVEWPNRVPPNANGPWVIGIVGDNPIGNELPQIITGKTVQGHELQVRRFQNGEDLHVCKVLFISASERKRLPSLLAALRGSSVLTVGDMDHFLEYGGMIQFVKRDKQVKIAVNVGATNRGELRVSSKLLSLGRMVVEAEQVGNN
jgi:hypothetical protein